MFSCYYKSEENFSKKKDKRLEVISKQSDMDLFHRFGKFFDLKNRESTKNLNINVTSY